MSEAGLVFIGPPPEAIAAMGDKAAARGRMQAAGVPVCPAGRETTTMPPCAGTAGTLGYPVMIKAAAGGGGVGMRVAGQPEELDEALAAARREARAAFGDERLILERYVPRGHHVEFQVLADGHGNVLHLFERECSVQRRHQKIVEETPSPILDGDLRAHMAAAAVAAARAAGYRNAGTVEFIVDPLTREFYFLEMNTRLQVEHPITEMVVGPDLAQWQIRIAAGERLSFRQEDLAQRGHAIECRLYAEDPANRFLPATGRLLRFVEPRGPGVRVDSGVTSGDEISVYYDPLIAKLIVHAEDRPAAIRKMLDGARRNGAAGDHHQLAVSAGRAGPPHLPGREGAHDLDRRGVRGLAGATVRDSARGAGRGGAVRSADRAGCRAGPLPPGNGAGPARPPTRTARGGSATTSVLASEASMRYRYQSGGSTYEVHLERRGDGLPGDDRRPGLRPGGARRPTRRAEPALRRPRTPPGQRRPAGCTRSTGARRAT